MSAPSRNAPCPCGSGKKHKNCCLKKALQAQQSSGQTKDQLLQTALRHHQEGRLPQAETLYRQILQKNPDHPDALHLLGTLYHQTGNNEVAVEFISRAMRIDPSNPFFHDNLGTVYQALDRLDDAVSCYQKVLALEPYYPEAHFNLGNVLNRQGQLDNAVTCYQKALALRSDYVDAYISLGNTFKDLGNLAEAMVCYQKTLAFNPNYAEVHFNLGIAFQEQGKWDEAINCYHNALSLKPDYTEVHNNLGLVLQEQDRIDEAINSYHKALSLKPDYAEAHSNLGIALQAQGKLDEAIHCYHHALSLTPNYVKAYAGLASVYIDLGQFEAAQLAISSALEIQPENPTAWAILPRLRKLTLEDAEWLNRALSLTSQANSQETIAMQFAIGKYYDDTRQYDLAFAAYRQGNMLKRQREDKFDRAGLSQLVDALIASYTADVAGSQREGASLSQRPVMIVGMPRSGTSLIEQIIASHPDAAGAGELSFWDSQVKANWAASISGDYEPALIAGIAASYEQILQQCSAEASRVVDKMPHNFIRLGLISATFPQARIIHAQRNPVDTCLSIYFQNLGPLHSYGTDIDDLAFYYREYIRLMQHWRAVLPADRFLDVPYEALVDDQAAWSQRMIEFIGLDWDERCLDFHKTERKVGTASNWQVRQKIYSSSKARWRNYENHLGPLLGLLDLNLG